jgi:hypothetical protein
MDSLFGGTKDGVCLGEGYWGSLHGGFGLPSAVLEKSGLEKVRFTVGCFLCGRIEILVALEHIICHLRLCHNKRFRRFVSM